MSIRQESTFQPVFDYFERLFQTLDVYADGLIWETCQIAKSRSCQFFTALTAAAINNFTAMSGLHSGSKSALCFAATFAGLVSTIHGRILFFKIDPLV